MDVTTQRRCLGILAAGLFAGTVGAVGWSLSGLEGDRGVVSPRPQATPLTELPAQESTFPFDESFAARPLRRPLFDPPPVAAAPPPKPTPKVVERPTPPPAPPKLEVTLVGTIIQPDQSLAIVADASGEFDVKGIGESLELSPQGITVERIESERVTLRYQGRESTIELDRSAVAGNATGGNRGGPKRRNNR